MKSEPDEFGITDLATKRVETWTGVRSYFARANLRKMTVGDEVLFHHSSVTPPGVAGLARVIKSGVVDETQFDPASKYYDPASKREAPTWDCVDVEYVETFPYFVTMDRIRADPALAEMAVLKPGRLSVQPVAEAEYQRVVELGHIEPPPPPPKVKRPAKKKKPAKRRAVKRARRR